MGCVCVCLRVDIQFLLFVGLTQVVATNPYELVKVRLQLQAQEGHSRKSATQIVRELGVRGLVSTCVCVCHALTV